MIAIVLLPELSYISELKRNCEKFSDNKSIK